MYIFGGNDIREGTMNNLWNFDLESLADLRDSQTPGVKLEWKTI